MNGLFSKALRRGSKGARCALGFLAVAVLSGCSTVATRIQQEPEAFARLRPADRQLVSHGRIREGLSKGAVYIAWGKPDEVNGGSRAGRPFETWFYYAYSSMPYPLLAPYRPGRRIGPEYFYAPGFYGTPHVYRSATFENEKVVAWSSSLSR